MNKLGFVCAKALSTLAIENSDIWVLDGDLADSDGAELFAQTHPSRFIAAGIAEQSMVSIACGLARCGKRPWVFSFASFLCYRAYDQIRVGISQTNLPIVLVGSHAGACSGSNGKTHVAINDIAIMASLPNIQIWTPGDECDVNASVSDIILNKRPAYVRLPRSPLPILPQRQNASYCWIGSPSSFSIISCGIGTHWALKARDFLDRLGLSIGILHLRCIWPLDSILLKELLKGVQQIIVIDDHYKFGGLTTCIQSILPELSLEHWGWPANWSGQSGSEADILASQKVDAQALATYIKHKIT